LEHAFFDFAKFDSIARDSLVGLQIEHAGESFVIVVKSAHTNAFGTIDPLCFAVDSFLSDCIIVVMNNETAKNDQKDGGSHLSVL